MGSPRPIDFRLFLGSTRGAIYVRLNGAGACSDTRALGAVQNCWPQPRTRAVEGYEARPTSSDGFCSLTRTEVGCKVEAMLGSPHNRDRTGRRWMTTGSPSLKRLFQVMTSIQGPESRSAFT